MPLVIPKPKAIQGLIAEAVLIQALLKAFLGRREGILKPGVKSMGYSFDSLDAQAVTSICVYVFNVLYTVYTMFDEKKSHIWKAKDTLKHAKCDQNGELMWPWAQCSNIQAGMTPPSFSQLPPSHIPAASASVQFNSGLKS